MKQTQQGFIGIVLVIIAALAVGGGVYYAKKAKEVRETNIATVSTETTSSTAESAVNTQARPTSGGSVSLSTHMTLDEILALNEGRTMQCTGSMISNGATISSTTYVNGKTIRGDSTIVHNGATTKGSVVLKDGIVYAWTGSTGTKVKVSASFNLATALSLPGAPAQPQSYDCVPWTVDAAKFVPPATITFKDYGSITLPSF